MHQHDGLCGVRVSSGGELQGSDWGSDVDVILGVVILFQDVVGVV